MTRNDDSARVRARAPDQPPCDSRAEDALLSMALINPHLVGELDIGADLYFPEHRAIWRAMVRVHMHQVEIELADFWIALRCEMHTMLCRTRDDHAADREHCEGFRYLQVLSCESANPKDIGYWTRRIKRCAEARNGIQAAHEIAAGYWRVPEQPFGALEAHAILGRLVPPPRPTLAERVLKV